MGCITYLTLSQKSFPEATALRTFLISLSLLQWPPLLILFSSSWFGILLLPKRDLRILPTLLHRRVQLLIPWIRKCRFHSLQLEGQNDTHLHPPAHLCLGAPRRLGVCIWVYPSWPPVIRSSMCSNQSQTVFSPQQTGECCSLHIRKENWKTALAWVISEWSNCERWEFSSFCLYVLSECSIVQASI